MKPTAMSPRLEALIHASKYLGTHGALAVVKDEHLSFAKKGSILDMMVVSNVYYSAASSMKNGKIFMKLYALFLLYSSYRYTRKALLREVGENEHALPDTRTLSRLEMRLRLREPSVKFQYGDLHIFMSQLTHIAKVKRKCGMVTNEDFELAKECNHVIRHSNQINLIMLSRATLLEWPELDKDERNEIMVYTNNFLARNQDSKDPDTQQVVIRICRARGDHYAAKVLAEKFGTNDQRIKAGLPPKEKPYHGNHSTHQGGY